MSDVYRAANAVFLDPESCGSSVLYRVCATSRKSSNKEVVVNIDCAVELRDCDRKISWHAYGLDELDMFQRKLTRAIVLLQEAKRMVEKGRVAAWKKRR